MLKINIFLLILNNILLIFGKIDYCVKNPLCKNSSGPHIMCDNDGKFSQQCPDNAELIKLSRQDMKGIIKAHNVKRNDIAAGQIAGYEPAVRMGKMKWSPQLANMAELNAKRCVAKHDKCHNTPSYLYSGQNIYSWSGYLPPTNHKDIFYTAIDKWFSEYKDCDMSYINKFRNERVQNIGHFTVMVSERNTAVGCAGVLFKKGKYTKMVVTCNYAFTNIVDKPIYKAGKTGSGCTQGVDFKYKSLCKATEKYNVNVI